MTDKTVKVVALVVWALATVAAFVTIGLNKGHERRVKAESEAFQEVEGLCKHGLLTCHVDVDGNIVVGGMR